MCARVQPAVSGLEQEFPGKVVAQNVDAKEPRASEEIRELGFKTHGLVIRSARGEVLWKQPDHDVDVEQARRKLRELLERG